MTAITPVPATLAKLSTVGMPAPEVAKTPVDPRPVVLTFSTPNVPPAVNLPRHTLAGFCGKGWGGANRKP